jgi:hypothetical protein
MREQALRLMANRQAGMEPLALSASGRQRMLYGPTAASEDKRIGFSVGIARFGAILKERDRSSRSGPVRSLPNRLSVSGSSQRGRVCARPDPRWSRRGAWDGRMVISGQ